MDLTKSSETKHLYLGDSSGSALLVWLRSPSVTSDVSCNNRVIKYYKVTTIHSESYC